MPQPPTTIDTDKLLRTRHRLKRLSVFLDDAFEIPVIKTRIGWDAIIGFIPVIGDIAGALISLVIVLQALKLKVPKYLIIKMLANIGIELVAGLKKDLPFKILIADYAPAYSLSPHGHREVP